MTTNNLKDTKDPFIIKNMTRDEKAKIRYYLARLQKNTGVRITISRFLVECALREVGKLDGGTEEQVEADEVEE